MSYEYKEKIKKDLEYSLEGVSIDYYSSEELIHKQKVKELDNVYAQAAKADEYEAKAKAWDKLSMSIRECNKEIELKGGLNAMFRTSKKGQIVQRYIDCFESGESDELRE